MCDAKLCKKHSLEQHLETFHFLEILDSQGNAEKHFKNVIQKPKLLNNISTEDVFENISMIVENHLKRIQF